MLNNMKPANPGPTPAEIREASRHYLLRKKPEELRDMADSLEKANPQGFSGAIRVLRMAVASPRNQ
jgi:hypothetical protein